MFVSADIVGQLAVRRWLCGSIRFLKMRRAGDMVKRAPEELPCNMGKKIRPSVEISTDWQDQRPLGIVAHRTFRENSDCVQGSSRRKLRHHSS